MERLHQTVILLHGLRKSAAHMRPLAQHLEAQGYDVYNIDYPSNEHDLTTLIRMLTARILALTTTSQTVHFVGFSMGALIIRGILHTYRPKSLGRVVQIGPPNQGSQLSDRLKNLWLYRKWFGPAGQELQTNQSSIQHLFGPIDYELGVIAGKQTYDLSVAWAFNSPNDGRVAIEHTKVDGMKDHIVMPGHHIYFPKKKNVINQVCYFLKHGCFYRKPT